MTAYTISYDLHRPGRDYTQLHNAIKSLGTHWAKPLESYWIVVTSMTSSSNVVDKLLPYMDTNDSLFVTKLGADWGSYNIPKDVVTFLQGL